MSKPDDHLTLEQRKEMVDQAHKISVDMLKRFTTLLQEVVTHYSVEDSRLFNLMLTMFISRLIALLAKRGAISIPVLMGAMSTAFSEVGLDGELEIKQVNEDGSVVDLTHGRHVDDGDGVTNPSGDDEVGTISYADMAKRTVH